MRWLLRVFQRAARARDGGIAVMFAVAVPALVMLACGAIELASLSAEHSAMQDAADATALAMAKTLGVATAVGLDARANNYARAQLGDLASKDAVQTTASVDTINRTVTVQLSGHRESFFGNLLPPGGWDLNVSATAQSLGEVPLCVLSYGQAGMYNLNVNDQSVLTAANCLVQSNGNITVGNSAGLNAGLAQAVGAAKGPITPAAQSGAPPISDPFASVSITMNGYVCPPTPPVTYLSTGTNVLPAGVHCGDLNVQNGASLILSPGDHFFVHGNLNLQGSATLTGSDVALVFDKQSHFDFAGQSTVMLSGRTSGQYAGFVIATTRENTGTFNISATSAEKLEGTIYIPAATLHVQGTANRVAQQSAWTVVVAQSIQLSGSAHLIINSSYATSSVPVPNGVGASFSDSSVVLKR
ncbi:MAG TPA: pilus assembly protein TadG-related protein [Caulobacteraceae bacterium]|nr:pilus assembly protein TadG-related protein [Caulobacteraceae bacterium]